MTKTTVTFADKIDAKLATLMSGNAYDTGKVNALSKSIKGRSAILDVDLHSAAVAALSLSDLHRDANSMALLLNAMGKGARRETLAAWAAAFGNIVVTKDKAGTFKCKMLAVDDCLPVDMVKAKATPFWSAPEKVTAGAFNDLAACKLLAAFLKRAKADKADLTPAMLHLVDTVSAEFITVAPADMLEGAK